MLNSPWAETYSIIISYDDTYAEYHQHIYYQIYSRGVYLSHFPTYQTFQALLSLALWVGHLPSCNSGLHSITERVLGDYVESTVITNIFNFSFILKTKLVVITPYVDKNPLFQKHYLHSMVSSYLYHCLVPVLQVKNLLSLFPQSSSAD